ncbi:MAG: pyridoxal phosphate enzyme (YggS family) [Urechidicola sp.]|jgi:pyridoxal phosphate enzyme (YggS family)|tara:strand:- start:373 stop:1023 length:651 start_codon:yes stop_codon:yes gene_type:complete
MIIAENLQKTNISLPKSVTLVAVSKTKPISDLKEAYDAGQRIFGENKIQEMVEKYEALPKDIEWHMIGHLQRNKIKYMAHFVGLIHGVDSLKTLKEINKQAKKHNRVIECLLQVKIATEDTKFGLESSEINSILFSEEYKEFENICVTGFMGMSTFTDDKNQVRNEFKSLKTIFDSQKKGNPNFKVISMGMSGDYTIAIEEGSTMIRIGSSIFGSR